MGDICEVEVEVELAQSLLSVHTLIYLLAVLCGDDGLVVLWAPSTYTLLDSCHEKIKVVKIFNLEVLRLFVYGEPIFSTHTYFRKLFPPQSPPPYLVLTPELTRGQTRWNLSVLGGTQ